MSQKKVLLMVAAGVILAASLPYLAAFQAGDGQQFGGFLINPVDGNSYLAKMQEGWRGEWKFRLPYTAQPGDGAYLFLYYLALGHLSNWAGISLLGVFHGARIAGAGALIWAVYRLCKDTFPEIWEQTAGFALILMGSGLGWIAVLLGMFSSDLWVAEAYPFLSLYTNPHFGLGLALMILAVLPAKKSPLLAKGILGLAIGIIQPFGVVIIGLVLSLDSILWAAQEKPAEEKLLRSPKIKGLISFGLAGGTVLVYQYLAILTDPVLAAWHAQNQTPTPSVIDLLASFSPALVLAVFGVKEAWRSPQARRLVIWAGVSCLLIAVPWALQRRFLTGLYVPLASLSILGLSWLTKNSPEKRGFWLALVMILSLPTNLIVLASGVQAAEQGDPSIFITVDEDAVLEWIESETQPNDLILADQNLGLLIPSRTGRRVVYGHPFETASAEAEKDFVEDFFNQAHTPDYYQAQLDERGVGYLVLPGDADPALKAWLDGHWERMYRSGGLEIFGRLSQ